MITMSSRPSIRRGISLCMPNRLPQPLDSCDPEQPDSNTDCCTVACIRVRRVHVRIGYDGVSIPCGPEELDPQALATLVCECHGAPLGKLDGQHLVAFMSPACVYCGCMWTLGQDGYMLQSWLSDSEARSAHFGPSLTASTPPGLSSANPVHWVCGLLTACTQHCIYLLGILR